MSMRARGEGKPRVIKDNAERWLLTYADMITLLMLFFIVMYALSTQDVRKYSIIAKSLNAAFQVDVRAAPMADLQETGAGEELLENMKEAQGGALEDRQLANIIDSIAVQNGTYEELTTSYSSEGVVISVLNSLLFKSGHADLRPEAKQTLGAVTRLIADLPYAVRVEGHTDDLQPIGSLYQSNLELSIARGYAVAQFLNNAGVATSRLSAAGYGDTRPRVANSSSTNRAQNRRVDIVILTRAAEREVIPVRP